MLKVMDEVEAPMLPTFNYHFSELSRLYVEAKDNVKLSQPLSGYPSDTNCVRAIFDQKQRKSKNGWYSAYFPWGRFPFRAWKPCSISHQVPYYAGASLQKRQPGFLQRNPGHPTFFDERHSHGVGD